MTATRDSDGAAPGAYGRNFSFFSHRVFVAYQPGELHDYLARLFTDPDAPTGTAAGPASIDAELARWILLHRSQLNPLRLNRLIESWRAPNDELRVPESDGARSASYRVDITMQFAIELELAAAHHAEWLQDRQHLYQARLDAAYYVSRRRPACDETDVMLDLSDSAKPAFRVYLRSRMNLMEDTSLNGDAKDDPLRVDELDWLFELARGVARSLSWQGDSSVLRQRWETSVVGEARRPYGNLAAPSDSLYSSLLCGQQSVLLAVDSAPHAYQWRYLAIGKTSVRTTLKQVVQSSLAARKLIDRVESALLAVLGGGQTAAVHPLQALADRYRVLPTAQPWSAVARARAQMQIADAGGGSVPEADAAATKLEQYAQMLRIDAVAQAAALALLLAAVLAGAARAGAPTSASPLPSGPTAAEWDAALLRTCNGLRLDLRDLTSVLETLRSTYDALRLWVVSAPEVPAAPVQTLHEALADPKPWNLDDLKPAITCAFDSGVALGADSSLGDLNKIVTAAWADLRQRLTADAETMRQPASAAELLTAARLTALDTSSPLGARLDQVPLREWTALLLAAMKDAAGPNGKHAQTPVARPAAAASHERTPPLSLVPHVLRHLGVLGIGGVGALPALLAALGLPQPLGSELSDAVRQFPLWSHDSPPRRLALVLYRGSSSVTDGWPLPPQQGVVMAVTPDQLATLLKWADPAWLGSLEMLRLAWDIGDEAANQIELDFRQQLTPLLRLPCTRELWLYGRAEGGGRRTPRLIQPRQADELWIDLPPE